MKIEKIKITNYKLLRDVELELNEGTNIFVGQNDSGKSSILEAISIVTTGKLDGYVFERQIKANIFNSIVRKEYVESLKYYPDVLEPPQILFEAYCENADVNREYAGTNNFYNEDVPGIRVLVSFDSEYANTYCKMLKCGDIYDIPIEFYKVTYTYFKGEKVIYRFCPLKAAIIDTTRKDYSYVVDRFVSENITEYLSGQEQVDLSTAYRKSRNYFHTNDTVIKLNESVKKNVHIGERTISIDLKEEDIDDWKKQMSIVVDDTPFENIGFGSQNIIKIELALKHTTEQVNMVLMEEPENNLSFTNMQKLLKHIQKSNDKQIFISTHSSFVANKLGLENLFVINCGNAVSLRKLNEQAKRYFKKLPGYDTLRLVLAEKVILVEGPTDDLIIQRAFIDENGVLPSEQGIDIIVVDSLAFKRYSDIAILMKKKVRIVTDNDGSIQENVINKYADYLGSEYIEIVHETNEALRTIEPSIVDVNCENSIPTESFKQAISKSNSMMKKSKDQILDFMKNNKVEWAMRVFEATDKIVYPRYIKNAIKEFN
jgi:putative ATP-dependent endonuclease of OLD family